MTVKAEPEGILETRDMLGEVMTSEGFGSHQVLQAQLALEEACTNIAMYSYPSGEGMVSVSAELAEGVLKIELIDYGEPFDAASYNIRPPSGNLTERRVGGMGIYLIKRLMDDVSYERRDGRNILRLVIKSKIDPKV
jgi:serine/threonine-protein kinase RsbW